MRKSEGPACACVQLQQAVLWLQQGTCTEVKMGVTGRQISGHNQHACSMQLRSMFRAACAQCRCDVSSMAAGRDGALQRAAGAVAGVVCALPHDGRRAQRAAHQQVGGCAAPRFACPCAWLAPRTVLLYFEREELCVRGRGVCAAGRCVGSTSRLGPVRLLLAPSPMSTQSPAPHCSWHIHTPISSTTQLLHNTTSRPQPHPLHRARGRGRGGARAGRPVGRVTG